ncbi:MAG: sulfatase-like hydrolase/transferase [Kiritimatiellaeota bacterium]|nr:sulfatase-like hydrolase/transferase [Kiritimatiellota bacterium]
MKRAFLMLCAACWLALVCAAPAAPAKPNILLVVLDDIGVGDLGFCGARDIPTPNIDRLAREGVTCTAGYVQPMCAPTRAMLLTGRYPQRLGYEDNRPFDAAHTGLERSIPTLPEKLREAGYATALVGKWHLGKGLKFEYAPRNRGFDEFFGYFGAFGSYVNPTYSRNGVAQVYPGYGTDLLTAEACARVRAWKDKPFFLHLAYTAAHLKQEAKPADLAKFAHLEPKRQMAAAIISNLDENIGRLRQALQDAGLTERTLTFFLSDNGAEPLVLGTRNGPYRGQGGVRVPFVVHWPGTLPAGRTYAAPVAAMDVMPTCLAAAGAATSETDGVNLLPFLVGTSNAVPHEALFWRTTDHAQWRRAREQGKAPSHLSAVRQGDWKLVVLDEEGANRQKLFNLADDPSEARDLAAQEPERHQALRAALDTWRASLKPQIIPPVPRNHAGQPTAKPTSEQP